jgi:hypothetical protein
MKLFPAILTAMFFIIHSNELKAQGTNSFNIDNQMPHSLIESMSAQQKNISGACFNQRVQLNSGFNKKIVTVNQVWCPDTLTIYTLDYIARFMDTYNRKALTTKRLIQVYSNGQWGNYSLDTWTYLNENNDSVDVGQVWSNNQWTNATLDSSTYDTKGQMLVHLYKYWRQGAWVDSLLTFRTYDANENMLTNWGEVWSGTQWIKLPRSYTYSYTYDESGHKLTELYQISENGQTENATLSTYTYDANGNMLSYLLQISANGKMTNQMLHTYTYDANGKLLTDWLKGWTNESWMNGSLYTYTYDANGNKLNQLIQYWLNGKWTDTYQTIYTYDSHGNALTGNNTIWTGSSWKQADSAFDIRFYDGSSFNYSGYKVDISYTPLTITEISSADFNKDGSVNLGDLVLLGSAWESTDPNDLIIYDLNKDGSIGLADLVILGSQWTGSRKDAKAVSTTGEFFDMTVKRNNDFSMFYVNVSTKDVADIDGLAFSLKYDPNLFEFVKDSISGLGTISVNNETTAGVIDLASVYKNEKFTGAITLGFKIKDKTGDVNVRMMNAEVSINGIVSLVKDKTVVLKALPNSFDLFQNSPNPFNPTTTITFSLAESGPVTMKIYNTVGNLAVTLVDRSYSAGKYSVVWNARDMASGIYFCRIQSGSKAAVRKLMLLK